MPRTRFRPEDVGNARDSFGRPYRETLISGCGAGITAGSGTLYKTAIRREGSLIYTDIFMDLTGLSSSTTDLDIIGTAGVCHIGQITPAECGTIVGGWMRCLEVPAGGIDDIDLYAATEGTGAYDGAISGLVETAVVTAGGAWTLDEVIPRIADTVTANQYLYLTGGAGGTAAAYTAGRFLITLVGY